MNNRDGGLVGRCSIDPNSFIKLCHITDQLNCRELDNDYRCHERNIRR